MYRVGGKILSFINCVDAITMVVEEVTEKQKLSWKLNRDKLCLLEAYCKTIDDLMEDFDGYSYKVEIDDFDMTITISLECSCAYAESNDKFCTLSKRTNSLNFSVSKNGNLNINFVFPPVWDKI